MFKFTRSYIYSLIYIQQSHSIIFLILPPFPPSVDHGVMDVENIDPSIRVQVLPSQNAYFAGETFSVTITFTSTRLPVNPNHATDPVSAPTPVHKSHKRNAHSISSAPLARPPTSPGLGSRPPDIVRALGVGIGDGRKGLIGNGNDNGKGKGKEVLEARRSALEREKENVRSASVDIKVNGHGEYVQAYQVDHGEF